MFLVTFCQLLLFLHKQTDNQPTKSWIGYHSPLMLVYFFMRAVFLIADGISINLFMIKPSF